MDWQRILSHVNAETARAFISAARHLIDTLLLEAERVGELETPPPRDYATAELPRTAPAGGWLSHAELRRTSRELAEALAAEKWTEGVLLTVRVLGALGGGAV